MIATEVMEALGFPSRASEYRPDDPGCITVLAAISLIIIEPVARCTLPTFNDESSR